MADMKAGLSGKESDSDMIRTWADIPKNPPKNQKVIVIDAGGTNFRSCLVTFDAEGKPSISDLKKTSMPGIKCEVSKEEFFDTIAENISYLKDKADRIGFCFSYPMEITKEGDGIPTCFTKEIKASSVLGLPIGKNLKEKLESLGWSKINGISLMNDTVSALLAGAADSGGKSYSSYVGFILGTGLNAAYIQKTDPAYKIDRQIIDCECGKFSNIKSSDVDIALDKGREHQGLSLIEKASSGAYLGGVILQILRSASEEGLFSQETCKNILGIDSLGLFDADLFMHFPAKEGLLSNAAATKEDVELIHELSMAAVSRSASYAAAIIATSVLMTGEGKKSSEPVCVLCDGTTFHKTYGLKEMVSRLLLEFLTEKRGIHFELISMENDITLGTAVGALE